MALILHCTRQIDWQKAVSVGLYNSPSLEKEGFIHFSTMAQLLSVVNQMFRGQKGLVLLCVESDLLAEVRYENLEHGTELYPHVYGPVNLDAVMRVLDFPPTANGTFRLPASLVH
jgi:uncharacterized protein (DUF952 family)